MYRLQVKDLTKSYGNITALRGINLELSNGMFGLLGPNGAGKSTLMRTLATLQLPDSGTILFDGKDVMSDPQSLRLQLGYLPQDFGVYPRISAMALLDHLAVLKGLTSKAERKEQVAALLQQTNLYQVRKQAVSTFSGGMRQRFGIAQALLGNPQLIIVDEPTAGLDPQERNRFHDLLSEIGEQIVVVLSTHIVEDVHDLCPAMAILAHGRIVLQGSPANLTWSLQDRVWRRVVDKSSAQHYLSYLNVISTRRVAGNVQLHVLSDQQPGEDFERCQPDLEDVYFSAIEGQKEGSIC